MAYTFISRNENASAITEMTRLLGVSRSSYYRWKKHGFSSRQEKSDASLLEVLRTIRGDHKYYGVLRMKAELREIYGMIVNRKRIARLLRKHGLNVKKKRKFVVTTDSVHDLAVCENILDRKFHAEKPGQKWVSDITYLPTRDGWRYLTTIVDLYDRKVIGRSYSETMDTEVTTAKALEMACINRCPLPGLIFHSDRGVQYCSSVFRNRLEAVCPDVRQSMSQKGNCWDNACAESFFKTLKLELEILDGKHSAREVRSALFQYIEVYYNRKRRHSAIDYQVPVEALYPKVA
jgi:transposase InsO family protein